LFESPQFSTINIDVIIFANFYLPLMSLDLENFDVLATLAFDLNNQYFCPNSPIAIVDCNVFVTIDCDSC
jgi:hypothetical protein